jgi:hypothetical protein
MRSWMMAPVNPDLRASNGVRLVFAAALGALLALAGCAGAPRSAGIPEAEGAPELAIPPNWPAPPAEIERRIAQDEIELRAVKGAGAGTTGALQMTIFFPAHGEQMRFKWKPVPPGDADGWNNAPRKELAAYALQSWFLEPPEYVVPTTALRCLPVEALRAHGVAASPSLEGTRCTLGVLSVWLDQVTVPQQVYEPERFASDARYAANVGRFNLLTYLVKHQDGRGGNILVSQESEARRVFAVDNGIAFDAPIRNVFVPNWDVIRVPAVPKSAIARLRGIDRARIGRLGVLAELRVDEEGMLRSVTPGANQDPEHGSRVAPGWLQLGLTRGELDTLEERLQDLLARVDSGELAQF